MKGKIIQTREKGRRPWHKSKEDAVFLYDMYGRLIDQMK